METNKIEQLLQQYYDGLTTPAQEQQLRDLLAAHPQLPQRLVADAALFMALHSDLPVDVPASLGKELARAIDARAREEQVQPTLWTRLSDMRHFIAGAAAMLLVALTIGLLAQHPAPRRDTYSDPREAYAEACRVLTLFSHEMNRGFAAVEHAHRARTTIKNQLNNIHHETDMDTPARNSH